MGSLSFVIRTFILTALLIMVLQVRWEGATLEVHTLKFIRSSNVSGLVSSTAEGAVRAITIGWGKVSQLFNSNFSDKFKSENKPGERLGKFHWNRSKDSLKEGAKDGVAFIKENADHARVKARESIRKFIDETEVPGQIQSEQIEE